MKSKLFLTILAAAFPSLTNSAQHTANSVWLPKANAHVTFCVANVSTREIDRSVLEKNFRFTNFDDDFKTNQCMHAQIDDEVVAVALYEQPAESQVFLSYLATAPERHRQGIAQELINRLAAHTHCAIIATYALPQSRNFFEAQGFKEQENGHYHIKQFPH